jgi:hypothetical protein
MPTPFHLVLGVAVLVGLGVLFAYGRRVVGAWLRYRGTRIVSCPENHETVAIEVDTPHAAWSAPGGHPDLRLADCTRWPEKAYCGQECLAQVESAPESCRLQALLAGWYRDRTCAFCGRAFSEIRWHDHKPALLSPEGALVAWSEFRPEQVHEVLASHKPVCWDCHLAEQFRREHPELVTERPERTSPPPSMA